MSANSLTYEVFHTSSNFEFNELLYSVSIFLMLMIPYAGWLFMTGTERPRCCSRAEFLQKLVTHEDPIHLHKILGLSSLMSYFFRYFIEYPTTGSLGFIDGSLFDWLTLTLHITLSSSSLIFHVLRYRITNRPMIIWEEYRLHAIVFSVRSFSCFIFSQMGLVNWVSLKQYLFIMAHHLVVDEITRRYGRGEGETTVRNKHDKVSNYSLVLKGYSFYQFAALASQLTPHPNSSDLGFNALIAIQSSAFLMTLYRKNIIAYHGHAFWYSFCLLISLFHMMRLITDPVYWMKVALAFFLRTKGVNKYLIWGLFSSAVALQGPYASPDVLRLLNLD